jgi:rare lipoprotein A
MHERTDTRWRVTRLQLFALITIAGAIFLNTAPYIDLITNTPRSDKTATIAEAPPAPQAPAARVVAHAEMQSTRLEGVASARVQPRDASRALRAANAPEPVPSREEEKSVSAEAEVLPMPQLAPKHGLAMLITPLPPLPMRSPKKARSAISRSETPPLPTRAPNEAPTGIAGSPLQQTGRASWYALDSLTASGEKLDDAALTAAHNDLPFGTKVRIKNVANGRSVVVRINDRGPFVAGRIIDVTKATAEALDMIAEGVVDVRLSVIYDRVASADAHARRGHVP